MALLLIAGVHTKYPDGAKPLGLISKRLSRRVEKKPFPQESPTPPHMLYFHIMYLLKGIPHPKTHWGEPTPSL